MKKAIIAFFLCCVMTQLMLAQSKEKKSSTDMYFGVGAGLDYGGFGAKVEFLPASQLGLFLGGGYNLARLTYNAGMSVKLTPKFTHSPTLLAMYGYNAVILDSRGDDTYYGFTLGLGYDYEVGKNNNKFSAAILFPFRNQAFEDVINSYPTSSKPKVNRGLISLGFNIAGSTKKSKK